MEFSNLKTEQVKRLLLVDIWRNPRNIAEFFISLLIWLYIFLNEYRIYKKIRIFYYIFYIPKAILKAILKATLNLIFIFLPYYPSQNKQDFNKSSRILPLFLTAYFVTIVLSYCMVWSLTFINNRLFSSVDIVQDGMYKLFNFNDDLANTILYIFVVPVYIALCVVIISISRSFQNQLSIRKNERTNEVQKVVDGTRPKLVQPKWSIGIMVIVVILAAILFSANYQHDVYNLLLCTSKDHCNSTQAPLLYWFLTEGDFGVTYNASGFYYIILNFILILTIIISVLFFYSSAFSVVAITKYIDKGLYDDFDDLSTDLRQYSLLYVYTKWLFLLFIINTYIWKISYLGDVENLDITLFAFTIIGSILLPLPNYIVQMSMNLRQRKLYLSDDHDLSKRSPAFSIFPRGRKMVMKNVANFFIALFFIKSIPGILIVLRDVFGIDTI